MKEFNILVKTQQLQYTDYTDTSRNNDGDYKNLIFVLMIFFCDSILLRHIINIHCET